MSNLDPIDVHDTEQAAELYELLVEAFESIAGFMRAERQARKLMEMPLND